MKKRKQMINPRDRFSFRPPEEESSSLLCLPPPNHHLPFRKTPFGQALAATPGAAHAPQPCPGSLTLHVEGDAVCEAIQLVVDHAHELLPVCLPAGHQPVPADHCDGAIAVPDLLELCFSFQLGVPGDSAGRLPIRRGAGSYQDLFCPASLGNERSLGALHAVRGLGCKEWQKEEEEMERDS